MEKKDLERIVEDIKKITIESGLYYKEVKHAVREHVLSMYKNNEISKDGWKYISKVIDKEL